jgi:hypothetical protein
MTFFSDVSDFFSKSVYGDFLKPIGEWSYNEVLKPGYNKFVEPIATTGVKVITQTGQNALNIQTGLANFASSPIFYVVVIGVGIIVLPRVLDVLAK